MLNSILKELDQRNQYLDNETIETIYFGGGTPSFVEASFIEQILNKIYAIHNVITDCEITLEANPDDLSLEKLIKYKKIGINRLSIGIQSFEDRILKYLNRIHDSNSSIYCVKDAQNTGFNNISIDLIYGIPETGLDYIEKTLEIFEQLNVQHLSAYSLTIEPKTVFGNYLKRGKIVPLEESLAHQQFMYLIQKLPELGYEQYEISNFSKHNYISKHNSSYWLNQKYLGIGPGAHSYNKLERSFNISNNNLYIERLRNNLNYSESEQLTNENKIDEYFMIRLRTKWGCDLNYLKEELNCDVNKNKIVNKLIQSDFIYVKDNVLKLTNKGLPIADNIILEIISNNGF